MMQVKRYKIVGATALKLMEIAIDDMMAKGYEPVGGIYGSLGQGFMQAMVGYEEVEDGEESQASDQ